MLEHEIALIEKHLDTDVNNSNSSYHIVAERIFTLKKELENIIEWMNESMNESKFINVSMYLAKNKKLANWGHLTKY